MKVLHVYRTYFPDTQGGLEESIRQICLGTSRLGVHCRVLSLSRRPNPSIVVRPEADVYRYPLNAEIASCGLSLGAVSGFRELAKWADVIHFHYPWPFADVLNLIVPHSRPTVLTYHSDIVRQRVLSYLYRPLMNRFLGGVDRIVATSPNYFATSRILARHAGKVEVIPIGLERTSYPAVSDSLLDQLRSQVGEGFFLFIGVLRYYKGLHILLDAMRDTDVRLVVVGAGPVERESKAHAGRLNLDNVVFLGHVRDEEKVGLIRLSRAIIFPSYLRAEAFGLALVEGAMYGKPLISTELGTGVYYVNIDGETGIVVSPGDPDALRNAMERLATDPAAAQRLGDGARARYEALLTAERMAQSYVAIYSGLPGLYKKT